MSSKPFVQITLSSSELCSFDYPPLSVAGDPAAAAEAAEPADAGQPAAERHSQPAAAGGAAAERGAAAAAGADHPGAADHRPPAAAPAATAQGPADHAAEAGAAAPDKAVPATGTLPRYINTWNKADAHFVLPLWAKVNNNKCLVIIVYTKLGGGARILDHIRS